MVCDLPGTEWDREKVIMNLLTSIVICRKGVYMTCGRKVHARADCSALNAGRASSLIASGGSLRLTLGP